MSQPESYPVTGMTCQHCVQAVKEEVGAVDGVAHVDVDLVPDGVSTIRVSGGDQPLNPSAIEAAIEEAGYDVAHA
ncbi:MAG: heavy metal transporter [Micrococcales bacterium]|nr:MAG: heavy metal transporter [Micrococcales bacterium]